MQEALKLFGNTAIYMFDKEESLAKAIGAKTTTDVIVLDSSRTVAYHGAIDDQYGFGYSIDLTSTATTNSTKKNLKPFRRCFNANPGGSG